MIFMVVWKQYLNDAERDQCEHAVGEDEAANDE
jgi:hypothetical protein